MRKQKVFLGCWRITRNQKLNNQKKPLRRLTPDKQERRGKNVKLDKTFENEIKKPQMVTANVNIDNTTTNLETLIQFEKDNNRKIMGSIMKRTAFTEIAARCAKLAVTTESNETGLMYEDYLNEYLEQFESGEYLIYLKIWIGYMVEEGNKEAIEIMKLLIKSNLNR